MFVSMSNSSRGARSRLAPLVGGLAAVLLLVAGCGGGGKKHAATTTTTSPSLSHSAAASARIAKAKLTIDMSTEDVRTFVLDLCGAATSRDRTLIDDDLKRLSLTSDADLRSTIIAIGEGAESYCPDGVRQSPNLLNEVYADVASTVATATTSTTEAAAGATTTIDVSGPSPGQISGF
jgi:hypothetical protein